MKQPDDLLPLLSEIQRLTHPNDMPRRVKLCQKALTLVSRDTQPEQWGKLQNELGTSLLQNPLGNRAKNLEQAIRYYKRSLEIYTRQATPYEWARSMNNLAFAYLHRIREERADNLEQAIDYFKEVQMIWTHQAFPYEWAISLNNLAEAYRFRIRGGRADNLERAISLSKQTQKVFTRQAFPYEWARSMNNLATVYNLRIRGKRADNLERAISFSKQAHQVFRSQAFPYEWAMNLNNLAAAYKDRIKGRRGDNLEQAIFLHKQSQNVFTRQAYPEKWAMSIGQLATAYLYRIQGERAENLEQAIFLNQQALEVYTRQAFPHEWAIICNNLALIFRNRIRGERAENLEQAISFSKQAQTILTQEASPHNWATSMNNLAEAHLHRIRGERADNLEQAIAYFKQAQKVWTRQAFPEKWALSCNNLAATYIYRITGGRYQNLEKAIDYLEQSLEVYTPQALPFEWARGMNNLANAYDERIKGERAKNLERAIDYFMQSLEVYTRQTFPFEWARSMSNLAGVYYNRIRGNPADNIEQAIYYFKQSLEVRTPQSFPQDCRDTAYGFGLVLYDRERLDDARQAFTTAHEAVEALRGEVVREGGRRKLGEKNADLYARLVTCYLHNADEEAAFEYATAGKGRAFVDMLASTRFDLFAASADNPALAADLRAYRELRQQIDNLRTRLAGRGTEIDEQLRKQEWEFLRNLQQKELERWEDLTYKYPALTATQSAPSLSVEAAQALASDLRATLVEFVQHTGGWSAFVVTSESLHHVPLSNVNDEFLQAMVIEWLNDIEKPAYQNEASYLALDEWYEVLIMPLKPHLPLSGRVALAPAGMLHLIPLSIARNTESKRYLSDEYALSFAPSLAALRVTHQESRKKGPIKALGSFLAVAYPGELGQLNYLPHAVSEAKRIETYFPEAKVSLYRKAATPKAVVEKAKRQAVIHLSCHGTFDSNLPEQSGLALSGGYLTVQRIITELSLSDARLVTLSACLTHRAGLSAGEEHVGLVQSVLTAGAQAVVASLWPVPERATRVLFEQFYGAVANGKVPAQALTEAMRYVRQQPGWEHPFYWAAFQVSGLGYDIGNDLDKAN